MCSVKSAAEREGCSVEGLPPLRNATFAATDTERRAANGDLRTRTGEYFPPLQFTCRNCGGGDRGRVAIYRPFGEVSLSLNRTVTCMVLKANDRRTSCPCHDEFRGPRSDYVRQVALATTQQTYAVYSS
ncbi:uncharacterized protein TNCV_1474421 [Trichonephila clavipes]|nr:uncharacterized protein TNCV_1474421 [Trichonephila clavipes]